MPVDVMIRPKDARRLNLNKEVTITLVNSDKSAGEFTFSDGETYNPSITLTVDGPTVVSLEPTANISPDSLYLISSAGAQDRYFRVPAGNANLSDLINQYKSAPIVRTRDAISSSESGGTVRLEFAALDGTTKVVTWQATGPPPTGSVDYAQLASGVADDIRGAFQTVDVLSTGLTFYDSAGTPHRANLLDGIREVIQAAVVNGAHTNIQISWNATTHGIDVVATGGSGGGGLDVDTVNGLIDAATENWAEVKHPTVKVPAGKLPVVSGTESGIIAPAEYARIHAAVDGTHLHDLPDKTAATLLDADAFVIDDSTVTDESGLSQTKEIRADQLREYLHETPNRDMQYDARLDAVEDFEDALRVFETVADDRLVTVSQANDAYAFPNPALILPSGDAGRHIEIVANTASGQGFTDPFVLRLEDLDAKADAVAGADLTDANSLKWVRDQVTRRIGKTSAREILLSASTAAAYYWTVKIATVNVTSKVDGATETAQGKISEGRVKALANAATVPATNVSVDATNFDGNLATTDDTMQKVAQKVDDLVAGGGGTDDQTATEVPVSTVTFNRILSARDNNMQKVANTLDDKVEPQSEELDEIKGAILPKGWSQPSSPANADYPFIASTYSTVQEPANPENFTFGARNDYAPESNGLYGLLKIPTSIPTSEYGNYRYFIGRTDGTYDVKNVILLNDSTKVHFLETTSGFSYYTVEMDDKPADDVSFVQQKHKLEADAALWQPFAPSLLELAPHPAIHELLATRFTRFSPTQTTTSSSSNQQTAAIAINIAGGSNFRLTDPDKQHGPLLGRAKITISTSGTDPNFGFEQGKANQTDQDRIVTVPIQMPVSDVRTATGVTELAGANAVRAYRQPFYSLNTLLGYAQVWIGRDGQQDLEGIGRFETAGGNVNNYTIKQEVDLAFLPTDPPDVPDAPVHFKLSASPATQVDIVTPDPSTAGGWSAWTDIASLPAITADKTGVAHITCELSGGLVEGSAGGADRVLLEYRIVRTRASVSTNLLTRRMYVRNIIVNTGNTSTAFADASAVVMAGNTATDVAALGDIYKVQARIVSQLVSGGTANRRTMRFATSPSFISIVGVHF